ncbi:MAG TPA: hypothetical protein VH496_11775 [Mycobacterium sp.]
MMVFRVTRSGDGATANDSAASLIGDGAAGAEPPGDSNGRTVSSATVVSSPPEASRPDAAAMVA